MDYFVFWGVLTAAASSYVIGDTFSAYNGLVYPTLVALTSSTLHVFILLQAVCYGVVALG